MVIFKYLYIKNDHSLYYRKKSQRKNVTENDMCRVRIKVN